MSIVRLACDSKQAFHPTSLLITLSCIGHGPINPPPFFLFRLFLPWLTDPLPSPPSPMAGLAGAPPAPFFSFALAFYD